MINLTKDAQDVPDLEFAGTDALADGQVHVRDAQGNPGVASGQKVVVEADGTSLELTTSDYPGEPGEDATYLSQDQAAGLAGKPAKMRLYGWGDSLRKWLSLAGVLVWAPALVTLVLGVAGLIFLSATSPTDRATVADAAKSVQAWLVDPPASAPATATARLTLAGQCLDGLAGRTIPDSVQIEGVDCTPEEPSFFEDKDNAALIAAIGGLLAALLGGLGVFGKFGFGKSP